ncbi:unnamed protein product [Clonostachys byssicola]|uniref:Uncharacterized protein n=1 Tax=Clonostachys byssicola TaxID=160290 RepID=A0A9N9UCB7_9HYPO|nr:unnamed protein product [Clonostachys byssicola]
MRLAYYRPQAPLPQDKILQLMRLWVEDEHCTHVMNRFDIDTSYKPCTVNAIGESCQTPFHDFHQDISAMEGWIAEAMCNKTVPIYVTAPGSKDMFGAHPSREFDRHISTSLFFWLYSRRFRPYRSNVEFGRFIAHPIHPAHLTPGLEPNALAQDVVSMHKAICSQVDSLVGKHKPKWAWAPHDDRDVYCDPRVYLLQPIFRALVMIFPSQDCNLFNANFTTIPVFLVLTGVTEGLSEPITFEFLDTKVECQRFSDTLIQLPLEDAILFVEKVEAREVAAYGQRPDLATMDQELYQYHLKLNGSEHAEEEMVRLGWEGEIRLECPSSEWVWNPKKYPDLAWKLWELVNDEELVWHDLR